MEEELKDLEKLPAEERIKRLREIERRRKKEIEEADSLIEKAVNEVREKEIHNEEETKKIRDILEDDSESLEEIAQQAKPLEDEKQGVQYGTAFETVRQQAPQRLYELSQQKTYESIWSLKKKSEHGHLNQQEMNRVNFYAGQLSSVNPDQASNISNEEKQRLMKSKHIIDQIRKYQMGSDAIDQKGGY